MIRRFNRYELKYVLDAARYRRVLADLSQFMVPDTHGDGEGFYRVCSLYYDSPDFSAYRSKIEGLKFRRKLRLRIYPGNDPRQVTAGHVEIKQRVNRTVQKRRLVLPIATAQALCRGEQPELELDDLDREVASEVHYMLRAQHLRPACIVSYLRQAFVAERYDSGMRLTFDMQLQGRTNALQVNELAKNRYVFPAGSVIMEVKVNERIPHWAVALLGRHQCTLERVSKYCAVISHEHGRIRAAMRNKKEGPWLT